MDFWGSDSEAAEAAYQDGAKSYYEFRSSYGDTITLVFKNKGGYNELLYQHSSRGVYRRVRRVNIL